jgi:alanyl-tRNA synthetase
VLRRLLRRAIRHGQLLGVDASSAAKGASPLMVPMVEQVIEQMAASYPDLVRQRDLVTRVAAAEEIDFGARIRQGLERVDQAIVEVRRADGGAFPGDAAFELHDTFGFPVDLTAEIAEDAGLSSTATGSTS